MKKYMSCFIYIKYNTFEKHYVKLWAMINKRNEDKNESHLG